MHKIRAENKGTELAVPSTLPGSSSSSPPSSTLLKSDHQFHQPNSYNFVIIVGVFSLFECSESIKPRPHLTTSFPRTFRYEFSSSAKEEVNFISAYKIFFINDMREIYEANKSYAIN